MDERNDMNRRDFVARAAVVATVALCGGSIVRCALADDSAPLPTYTIGSLTDYANDGVFDTQKAAHKIIVSREGGKLYVMTDICTHRGGKLNLDPKNPGHLVCPLHHAQFDGAGKVLKGPAKKPLVRYGVSADSSGVLTVDPNKVFDNDH